MRLIDADKVIDHLEKVKKESRSLVDVAYIIGFQSVIDVQPTAYDPDKVEEQLEKLKTINVDIGFGTTVSTLRKDVVMEIVKAGATDGN